MESKWSHMEPIFLEKNAKTKILKKCVSTAQACADCMWAHPMERPGRPQNQRKNITYFRTYFFNQKMQEYEKKGFQKVSKRMRGFPGWRPWGRLGRHNLIFDVKNAPKVNPKGAKGTPKSSKSNPKGAKGTPKCSKSNPQKECQSGSSASTNVSSKIPGPADCAKRLQLIHNHRIWWKTILT